MRGLKRDRTASVVIRGPRVHAEPSPRPLRTRHPRAPRADCRRRVRRTHTRGLTPDPQAPRHSPRTGGHQRNSADRTCRAAGEHHCAWLRPQRGSWPIPAPPSAHHRRGLRRPPRSDPRPRRPSCGSPRLRREATPSEIAGRSIRVRTRVTGRTWASWDTGPPSTRGAPVTSPLPHYTALVDTAVGATGMCGAARPSDPKHKKASSTPDSALKSPVGDTSARYMPRLYGGSSTPASPLTSSTSRSDRSPATSGAARGLGSPEMPRKMGSSRPPPRRRPSPSADPRAGGDPQAARVADQQHTIEILKAATIGHGVLSNPS